MLSQQPRFYNLLVRGKSLALVCLLLLLVGVFSYTRAGTPAHVYAATSSSLNFQARLQSNNGAIVPDGNYHIEFKLYSASSGGSALWTETHSTGNLVRIVNGYMTVNLGSVTAFPSTMNWDQEHWLTMNVGGSGGSPSYDGEMTPRLKLTAVPYAFSAGQLRKTLGANTSVLDFLNPTANRTLNLPDQDGTLCVQGSPDCVDVTTTSTTATTSSNSGLEISSDGLRLLGGCSDGQVLKWNSLTEKWECATGAGGGGSIAVRESDGSPSTSPSTLEFGPPSSSETEFIVTSQGGGVTRVRLGTDVLTVNNFAATLDGAYVQDSDTFVCPSGSGNLTGGGNTITLGAGGTCSALSTNPAVTFGTSVSTPLLTSSGALVIESTGSNALTLTSGSGLVILNASTISTTSGLSFDLANAANTIFNITNSGAGLASLNVEGSGTFGTGLTVTSGGANITGNLQLSGQFWAANGTAGAPAYSFTGDTNTGVYSGGADNLRLATGGVDRLTITSSGLVGVGTSDPAGALHVPVGTTSMFGYIDSPFVSFGAYQNYLLQTEAFNTANWVKTGIGAVTANSATDPKNAALAENIPAGTLSTHGLSQVITDATTGDWTFSVYLRSQAGTITTDLRIDSNTETGTTKTVTLTPTWQRFAVTQSFALANANKTVRILNGTNAISAWGAQLEPTNYARPYSGPRTTVALPAVTTTAQINTALSTTGALTIAGALTGATSGAFSGIVTITGSGLATTSTDRLALNNATAATVGVPVQMSPRLRLGGAVWNTTTATSNTSNWKIENLPLSGAVPTGQLVFGHDLAGAGYTNALVLNSNGNAAFGGSLSTGGTTRLTSGGALQNITGLSVISGGASITGNVTLGGSSSDRLTINGQVLGANALVFQGATDNGFATTFTITDPTANNTITIPNASGTIVLDGRSILTPAGSGLSGGGNLSVDRTLSLDIFGLTTKTTVNSLDYLAIYDDSTGLVKKISRTDLLQGIIGALVYQGTWNASTNTPTLADNTGVSGYTYAVSTGGTQNLGSGNITFGAGDFIIHNGTRWEQAPSASPVISVFGRGGTVTAQSGDYTASQITNTPAGNIAATSVQGALNELDNEKLGSLGGLTATTQTFANDTNVTITSSGSTHTLGWTGELSVSRGGTGGGSFTTNGIVYGNNTGALQVTAAGTSGQILIADGSGVPVFKSITGDVSIDANGVATVSGAADDSVELGTDTTGDYVESLGTLVGLSTIGNSGEASTPGLSVIYGSGADTAVEGDTAFTCASGTGDLSGGGGGAQALGGGIICGNITISESPVFDTSVTTPLLTYGGALTIQTTATGGADDLIFKTAGTEILRFLENGNLFFERGSNDATIVINTPGGAPATYTFDGASGTVLTTANFAAGGGLDAAYVNVGESPAAGDVSGSFTAGFSVNDVQNNAVDLGAETVGDYVQNLGTVVGLTITGTNSGEGSTPGLSVLYGSGANNAAAGANTFTCANGTGNLTGGGTVVTIGTSGTTCAAITTNAAVSFATSVTSPLFKNGGGLLTIETTLSAGTDDIVFNTAGTERLRLLETGGLSLVGNASIDGTIFDPTGNLVLDDTVDLGSAANGLRVNTDGSILDIDGNIILDDQLALGSGTTGLLITTDGIITDLDDSVITFGEGIVLTAGDLNVVAGNIQTANTTRIENDGDLVNIGNITGTGAMTILSGGSGALTLTSGSGTIILGSSTLQHSASSFNFDLANAGTSTFNISNSNGSNVAGLDVEGAITAGNGNAFSVNVDGDITSVFTQLNGASQTNGNSGAFGGSSTSMVVDSGANFDVGNYVRLTNTDCSGTVDICYAKITAKGGAGSNTLTITPALVWADNAQVAEFHIPEIGGIDTSQSLTNRYGRGYFISGVATGNGTTYYNEDSIETSLTTFNLLNTGVTTLNIGGDATDITLGSASTTLNLLGNLELGGVDIIDQSGNLNNIASLTGSGALAITSGGSGDLTFDSASGKIVLAANDTTLQRVAAGTYEIDLSDGSATSLKLNNSGAGVANLDLFDGGLSTAGVSRLTNGGILENITGLTITSGGANISGGLTLATGALNLTSGGITNAGAVAGASTINASGLITSVGLTAGSGLIQGTGGLTITGAVSLDGAISDPNSNLVLEDTVDIGSASTGLRVATDGSILDINGDLVLDDQLALGSATTGLLVTTDGVISDIDDASVSFSENLAVTAGGITVTGNSTVTGTFVTYGTGYNVFAGSASLSAYGYFRSVETSDSVSRYEFGAYDLSGASQGGRALVLNPLGGNVGVGGDLTPDGLFSVGATSQFQVDGSGLVTSVGLTAGSGLIQGTGGLTIVGAVSLDGAISDPNSNLVLDDIVDIGSAANGLRVATNGSLLDIDGNLVLDDQLALGSSTTGLLVTTGGTITDIDGTAVQFGESIAVSGNALIQQTATGAAIMIDRTDGVIASLKSGALKSGFYFDNTGSFSISTDTRANIASGTGAGTDILAALANGNVGFGTSAPDSRIHIVGGGLCIETADSGCAAASGTATIGSGLSILAGGASITGGIDNNSGGITETGAIAGATTIDASGLITGTAGLTITGAAASINASSNFAVNIGTGTSTGAITIGGGSGAFSIASTGIDISTLGAITNAPSLASVNNTNLTLDATGTGSLVFAGYNCSTQSNGGALTTNASGVVTCSADDSGISDARLKKNVVNLNDSILDKIKDVRTVNFDFDCEQEFFTERVLDCLTTRQTGVIAQELAQIFPELVSKGEDGFYRVKYDTLQIYNLKALAEIAKHINSNGEAVFSNTTMNSLTVVGDIKAGTIRADKIEGLEYNGRFESLEERVSSLEQKPAPATQPQQPSSSENLTTKDLTATGSTTLNATTIKGTGKFDKEVTFEDRVTINGHTDVEGLTVNTDLITKGTLEVDGKATFKEMARFEKDVSFQGRITVAGDADLQKLTVNLDLIVKGALLVDGPATFKEAVRFEKNVSFDGDVAVKGQTTVGSDTAGIVKLPSGQTVIKVKFSKPQNEVPIITLTLGDGKFAQYSYRNVTKEDFEIVISSVSTDDLNFSWTALQAQPKEEILP